MHPWILMGAAKYVSGCACKKTFLVVIVFLSYYICRWLHSVHTKNMWERLQFFLVTENMQIAWCNLRWNVYILWYNTDISNEAVHTFNLGGMMCSMKMLGNQNKSWLYSSIETKLTYTKMFFIDPPPPSKDYFRAPPQKQIISLN